MYYSGFGIIAAIVLLIENQDILFHYNDGFDKKEWKIYKSFLISVFLIETLKLSFKVFKLRFRTIEA